MKIPRLQRKLSIKVGLTICLALTIVSIVLLFIGNEHTFYSWDIAAYQNATSDITEVFRRSPGKAITKIQTSFSRDYNLLYTLPLIPFVLVFGESRFVYVLSIALIYLLPFSLVMGAIATKLIPEKTRIVFWGTAFLTLAIPPIWVPVLRGFPDVGGVLLIALATLIYLRDIQLQGRWQIPQIGFFLALSALFRRHFLFSDIAFLGAMASQAWLTFFHQLKDDRRIAWHQLLQKHIRIVLIVISGFLCLAILAWDFIIYLTQENYIGLYSSYKMPLEEVIRLWVLHIGLFVLIGMVLGVSISISTHRLWMPAGSFIALFGVITTIEWLWLRYVSFQYFIHFSLPIVLGIATLFWFFWSTLRGKLRLFTLITFAFCLINNGVAGLSSIPLLRNSITRHLWGSSNPPFSRPDYTEVVQLVNHLRQIAPNGEPIFIVASSLSWNPDLLINAERSLYSKKRSILNILNSPQVDSRDFYPLEMLLKAKYVLVVDPFQYHLNPSEQDVVKSVFDLFTENLGIAKDFTPTFQTLIHQSIGVQIYQRYQPTSLSRALHTLQYLRLKIGDAGSQLDWMLVSNPLPALISKDINNSYVIQANIDPRSNKSNTSVLYIGQMADRIKVEGILPYEADLCWGSTLRFTTLTQERTPLDRATSIHSPQQSPNFKVTLKGQNEAYLLLEILSHPNQGTNNACLVVIDKLRIQKIQ
jgi:hypothetical protein